MSASAAPASSRKPGGVVTPLTAVSSGYADEQYVPDVTISWLYKPHAILAICAVIGTFLYLGWTTDSEASSTLQNARTAFLAASAFIMILGFLVFPSGPLIRPHPIVWRGAFAVAVIYEMILIAILFQNKHDARQMMTFFDSSLGKPLVEKSYAADCTLSFDAVWSNIDMFVLSHFIGWAFKAVVIRDTPTLWVLSILWEFIEILFTHMLPNFAECWWDQWILDVLICNGLGIFVGQWVCKKLEMMNYHWKGVHEYPTYPEKARRVILQFAAPESWMRVRWPKGDSLKRFFGMHALIIAISLEELNAFFLKQLLWLPSSNYLNLVRLLFWFYFSLPCIRQFYIYMTDPTVQSIGRQAFLCVVIILTEVLIIVKMGQGEFHEPMPLKAKILGCVLATAYILYAGRGVYKILSRHPSQAAHSEVSDKYHKHIAAADAARVARITAIDAATATGAIVVEEDKVEVSSNATPTTTTSSRRSSARSRTAAATAAAAPVELSSSSETPSGTSDNESEVEDEEPRVTARPSRRSTSGSAAAAGANGVRSRAAATSPARTRKSSAAKAASAEAQTPAGRRGAARK